MLISIVVPVYNGSLSLQELYQRIKNTMETQELGFEIIMVDDSSPDDSFQVMHKLRNEDPRVKIIKLAENAGQHNATLCGMACSRGDYIITMDDDLQHPPEEIPRLWETIGQGYDVVFGVPQKKQEAWYRRLGSIMVNICMHFIYKHKNLHTSSFRIMTAETAAATIASAGSQSRVYLGALILESASRLQNVQVRNEPRKYGQSNYTLKKAAGLTADLLFNYSLIPLQVLIYLWLAAVLFNILIIVKLPAWLEAGLIITACLGLLSAIVVKEYAKRGHNRTAEKAFYKIEYAEL